jgi:hypothetical protein
MTKGSFAKILTYLAERRTFNREASAFLKWRIKT